VKPSVKFPVYMLYLACLSYMHMAWPVPHSTISFVKNMTKQWIWKRLHF